MSPTNPKKRSFAVRALRPNSSSNDRTGTKAAVQVCAHPGESGDLGERCHLALPECIASMAAFALCSAVAVSYANNEPIQCQLLALHKGGTRRKLPLPFAGSGLDDCELGIAETHRIDYRRHAVGRRHVGGSR